MECIKGLLFLQCVTANLVSIALRKPTRASSLYVSNATSSNVNDGSRNAAWFSWSCFTTHLKDSEPWWLVDLERDYVIAGFMVLNRKDCCPQRLKDFTVETFMQNPVDFPAAVASHCYFYSGYPALGARTVRDCDILAKGRYFRLRRSGTNDPLSVCEVDVYTTTAASLCSNFKRMTSARKVHGRSLVVESAIECAKACTMSITCLAFNFRMAECRVLLSPEEQSTGSGFSEPYGLLKHRWMLRKRC